LAEHERRLRENPTLDDVRSGDALNALLINLSNPKITLSGSRYDTVPLPQDFSLRDVVYRFAGAQGNTLDKAAKMFKTLDFAQELVGDVEQHEAGTVEELLAFIMKFRLPFADTEKRPEYGRLYQQRYSVLKQQKEVLGLKDEPLPPADEHASLTPAQRSGRPGNVMAKAKEHLEKVKDNLQKLNYPKNARKDASRDDAVTELDAAIKDIDNGSSPRERLERARKLIESLRDVSMKKAGDVKNLKDAADNLAAAVKYLQ
jgi:hypothetical protein